MATLALTKRFNALISTGIWIVLGLLLLIFQPLSWGVKIPEVFLIKQAIQFVLMVVSYYINARIIVPRTLFRNRPWPFVLWILAVTCLALFISEQVSTHLHISEAMAQAMGRALPKKPRGLDMFIAMSTLLALGVSTSVASFGRWQRDALLREELEKEKVTSELSFLKAQINPHFFFNTLNNIYALSFMDVPASQDALLKLSRMMRYLLYETRNDMTMLSKEMSFIGDYIQLMKLRMQETTKLIYREPAAYQDVQIAPMLLLPYIENAFKHGVSAMGDNAMLIDIQYADKQLLMTVENRIHRKNTIDQALQESSGIGLQNTRRRLELLYPGKHELHISDGVEQDKYQVTLKLDLT